MESIRKKINDNLKDEISPKIKEIFEKKEIERFKKFFDNPKCRYNENFKF